MNIYEFKNELYSPTVKKIILDTDTYNEIDDQFALAYAALATDKIELLSINAAPFFNTNSEGPKDGMEKSYQEILKLLGMLKKDYPVYRGSEDYLKDEVTPQPSDAADNIINTALSMPEGELLYVVAIGAITNVASALLKAPEIASRIAIIWLGGHDYSFPNTNEFNMGQDVAASRVVFNSSALLLQVPCMGVCNLLTTTPAELKYYLSGKNELCDYLVNIVDECCRPFMCGSRVIWDVSAVAMLALPTALDPVVIPRPVLTYEHYYGIDPGRPPMLYVRHLNRDAIFADLFTKLAAL